MIAVVWTCHIIWAIAQMVITIWCDAELRVSIELRKFFYVDFVVEWSFFLHSGNYWYIRKGIMVII